VALTPKKISAFEVVGGALDPDIEFAAYDPGISPLSDQNIRPTADQIKAFVLTGLAGTSVSYTPAGNISASTVEAAISELDSEKVAKAGDTMTGALQVPAGAAATPGLRVGDADTGLFLQASGKLGLAIDGTELFRMTAAGLAMGIGGNFDATAMAHLRAYTGSGEMWIESNAAASIFINRYSADATQPTLNYRKLRGSIASPAYPNQNDSVGSTAFQIWNGVTAENRNVVRFSATVLAATPGLSDSQGRFQIDVTPAGSSSVSEVMRWEHGTGISMYGANIVVDGNRIFRLRSYTMGTLPSAATAAGQMIYVSDAPSRQKLAVSDGTDWHFADGPLTENAQASSYTLVLADGNSRHVKITNASANNLTVPPNSSVAFAIGTSILVSSLGAGQTTFVPGSGVTIRSPGGALKLRVQYSAATLIKIGTDEWLLSGDIVV
jgi:hypothetical protein